MKIDPVSKPGSCVVTFTQADIKIAMIEYAKMLIPDLNKNVYFTAHIEHEDEYMINGQVNGEL